jgi:hypothetical protein
MAPLRNQHIACSQWRPCRHRWERHRRTCPGPWRRFDSTPCQRHPPNSGDRRLALSAAQAQKARADAASAAATARAAYADKFGAAVAALATCKSADSTDQVAALKAGLAAFTAEEAANVAALSANLPAAFSPDKIIPLKGSLQEVVNACAAAFAAATS